MKLKEFGPRGGGGARPSRPLRSATVGSVYLLYSLMSGIQSSPSFIRIDCTPFARLTFQESRGSSHCWNSYFSLQTVSNETIHLGQVFELIGYLVIISFLRIFMLVKRIKIWNCNKTFQYDANHPFADRLCFIINKLKDVRGVPVQWGPSWTRLDMSEGGSLPVQWGPSRDWLSVYSEVPAQRGVGAMYRGTPGLCPLWWAPLPRWTDKLTYTHDFVGGR